MTLAASRSPTVPRARRLPEPLCAVYEPASAPASCAPGPMPGRSRLPRKFPIQSGAGCRAARSARALDNVNLRRIPAGHAGPRPPTGDRGAPHPRAVLRVVARAGGPQRGDARDGRVRRASSTTNGGRHPFTLGPRCCGSRSMPSSATGRRSPPATRSCSSRQAGPSPPDCAPTDRPTAPSRRRTRTRGPDEPLPLQQHRSTSTPSAVPPIRPRAATPVRRAGCATTTKGCR